jgi:AraC-like DNA-binding protein
MAQRTKNLTPRDTRVPTDTGVPDYTVAARAVRTLVSFAVERGANERELLGRAAIGATDLAEDDGRIPLATYVRLVRSAKELLNDPAFALHFGEAFDVAEMSVPGLIGVSAETVSQAFEQVNHYSPLAIDVPINGDRRFALLSTDEGVWFVDNRARPNDAIELTESSFARVITSMRRTKLGAFVRRVHVTHEAPSYRREYDRIFGVPVVFASDRNAFLVDPALLTERLGRLSPYASDVVRAHADALMRRLDRPRSMRRRVEALLMPVLRSGGASMDLVARRLSMSRQTLRRRLQAEGVTFERLLEELRHRLALRYLSRREINVAQTAALLGFSDATALSRAFRRWTGVSPRHHRSTSASPPGPVPTSTTTPAPIRRLPEGKSVEP